MNRDDDTHADQWYEEKSRLMEDALGPEHDMVMHAIIPYAVGGALDLYYYPNGLSGTAIATKELSELPDEGPSNRVYDSYELVMFTRHALNLDAAGDDSTPFGAAHRTINSILNLMARYAEQATLNPHETCEFPPDMDDVGGKCLIFVGYSRHPVADGRHFGLLALIEVFREEMEFAREHGGAELVERLKEKRHYPFSDLDREPVV